MLPLSFLPLLASALSSWSYELQFPIASEIAKCGLMPVCWTGSETMINLELQILISKPPSSYSPPFWMIKGNWYNETKKWSQHIYRRRKGEHAGLLSVLINYGLLNQECHILTDPYFKKKMKMQFSKNTSKRNSYLFKNIPWRVGRSQKN